MKEYKYRDVLYQNPKKDMSGWQQYLYLTTSKSIGTLFFASYIYVVCYVEIQTKLD